MTYTLVGDSGPEEIVPQTRAKIFPAKYSADVMQRLSRLRAGCADGLVAGAQAVTDGIEAMEAEAEDDPR
jgi:hypothetical protein